MDPRLAMMVMRKEHEQRMKAIRRESDVRRALGEQTRSDGGYRWLFAGLRRALRVGNAGWPGRNGARSGDDATPRPSGGEASIAYSVEPAAA